VQDELPLAAREENAEGGEGAEEGDGEDSAECFENPAGFDEVYHLGWAGATLGIEPGLLFGIGWHGSLATCPASHAEQWLKENDVGAVGEVVWSAGSTEAG